MSGAARLRRPYAFQGRHLTGIDLAEQVERHEDLRALRASLSPRLGPEVAQEETEAVLAQALDDLGQELLDEVASDIDALLRTWSRLADAYRSAADRAEMGRIALELGGLPGRLEERVHMVPNAGGLIDAAIPTSLVSRLRYPVAAGRVSPELLAGLGRRLKSALPGAISHELLRVELLDRLVVQAVRPLLSGLSAQGRAAQLEPPPAPHRQAAGEGWRSHDPDRLATILSVGPLRLRRTWEPRPAPSAEHLPQGIEAIALSADGQRAIWGPWEPWLHPLGEAGTERRLGGLDGRAWWRHCLAAAVSADGRRAATGGASITVWDLSAGRVLLDLAEAETEELHALAFSPCGRKLAAVGASSALQVFDVGTGHTLWSTPLDEPGLAVTFSQDGRRVLAGGWAGVLTVHDAERGALLAAFDHIGGCINDVAVGLAGAIVVTAGGSSCAEGAPLDPDEVALRVWDAHSGAVVRDLPGHAQPVTQVALLDDLLLSIGDDGTLRAWSVQDGACLGVVDFGSLDDAPTALAAAGGVALVGTQAGWVAAFDILPLARPAAARPGA